MKFTTESIIQEFFFFIFIFSIIVLLDVLIRFKSPIRLKIFFLFVVLTVSVSTFCSLIRTGPDQYVFVFKLCKAALGLSVVQIFTDLYFIQHKKLANIHLISAIVFYIFLICYVQVVGYDHVFPKYNLIASVADQREFHYHLPFYINFFVYFYFIAFNLFALYFIYNILFKFNYNNIYFKKIQIWTFCFFMLIVGQLILILTSVVFKLPNEFKIYATLVITVALLLVILYRPSFINNNGSKISFGFLFNRNDFSSDIKEVDFNFQFFNNLYYKRKTANIEDFSNIMGVSKDVMFNFIYFTYSMSFDELVNKSRVEYFVEIIKDSKFKKYTVEALALEVGFSSRQRFYQPFKKYHGGNPSDLIDILNS